MHYMVMLILWVEWKFPFADRPYRGSPATFIVHRVPLYVPSNIHVVHASLSLSPPEIDYSIIFYERGVTPTDYN